MLPKVAMPFTGLLAVAPVSDAPVELDARLTVIEPLNAESGLPSESRARTSTGGEMAPPPPPPPPPFPEMPVKSEPVLQPPIARVISARMILELDSRILCHYPYSPKPFRQVTFLW